jgi:hypothetical protein
MSARTIKILGIAPFSSRRALTNGHKEKPERAAETPIKGESIIRWLKQRGVSRIMYILGAGVSP